MGRSDLESALRELARKRGVFRDDLTRELNRSLSDLRRCWSIYLHAQGEETARKIVIGNLRSLTDQLNVRTARQPELSAEQRKEQYWHGIRVYFNLPFDDLKEKYPPATYLPLRAMDLTRRREWLNDSARGHLKLAQSTGQDDVDNAIAQIEQMIRAAGYAPINQPDLSGDASATGHSLGDEVSGALPRVGAVEPASKPLPELSTPRKFLRAKFVAPAVATGVLLIAGLVVAFKPSGHSPNPKPSPSASAPPVLASFAQLAPAISDYNNIWVLPQILPASDAAHLSTLGFITARWAPQMGGRLVSDANYEVTLTGESPDGLTITNTVAVITKRSASLTGTLIDIGGQGMNSNQQYLFKLDQSPAEALYGDPNNQSYGQPVFAGNNLTLNKGESITITVEAAATSADYQFDLQATVVIDGKEQTVTITGPSNKPFEVTGWAKSYPSAFKYNFSSIVSVGAITDCAKQC